MDRGGGGGGGGADLMASSGWLVKEKVRNFASRKRIYSLENRNVVI